MLHLLVYSDTLAVVDETVLRNMQSISIQNTAHVLSWSEMSTARSDFIPDSGGYVRSGGGLHGTKLFSVCCVVDGNSGSD